MQVELEVLTLSVTDVDRTLAFCRDQVGFAPDVDHHPNERYRVVQLTPPGSACSIQFGIGLTDAQPGSARTTYLVVTDLEATHRELTGRGVPIGPIQHKAGADDWQGDWVPGIDPGHRAHASIAEFADPDGNTWLIQEVGHAS